MIDIKQLTILAKDAACSAGEEILSVYDSVDVGISMKEDNSPLTIADQLSHDKILEKLHISNIPVLSEEGKDISYDERKNWDYFWLIDPLDGTKEFIKRNGEFTVNIALIHSGKPVIGVVYVPTLGLLYYGSQGNGAYREENGRVEKLCVPSEKEITSIVASRSHLSEETQAFIDGFPGVEIISMGSSLKFMLIAENKAQIYPRFAPTMEWDTAAAQAVVEAAGGKVLTYPENDVMMYNKENLLNSWFLVC